VSGQASAGGPSTATRQEFGCRLYKCTRCAWFTRFRARLASSLDKSDVVGNVCRDPLQQFSMRQRLHHENEVPVAENPPTSCPQNTEPFGLRVSSMRASSSLCPLARQLSGKAPRITFEHSGSSKAILVSCGRRNGLVNGDVANNFQGGHCGNGRVRIFPLSSR